MNNSSATSLETSISWGLYPQRISLLVASLFRCMRFSARNDIKKPTEATEKKTKFTPCSPMLTMGASAREASRKGSSRSEDVSFTIERKTAGITKKRISTIFLLSNLSSSIRRHVVILSRSILFQFSVFQGIYAVELFFLRDEMADDQKGAIHVFQLFHIIPEFQVGVPVKSIIGLVQDKQFRIV